VLNIECDQLRPVQPGFGKDMKQGGVALAPQSAPVRRRQQAFRVVFFSAGVSGEYEDRGGTDTGRFVSRRP
jgi:hypothetical protein